MKRVLVAACALTAAAAALAAPTSAAPARGPRFGEPVLLTTDEAFGGYEPSIVVDRWNNVVVTAHKQNHNLVVSPDSRATTKVRNMSWIWWSKDHKAFSNMPGLTPAQEQNHVFGDEGDLATDDTGHVYFVDTSVVDNSFSRWKASGNGKLVLETVRPVGPFGEPVDDRPWIAAHGDGVVMYLGNQGDKMTYPGGQVQAGDGPAYGPGRYTVYMSYDHGDTFDPLGVTLNDSGWCRPTADKRRGSKMLYVVCTNDGGANDVTTNPGEPGFEKGTLWSYVSADDGRTWTRYQMGTYSAGDPWSTYPSVAIGRDGTVYALYNDNTHQGECNVVKQNTFTCDDNIKSSHLILYTSRTQGRTWTRQEVTPNKGLVRYSWIDVAPNGTLGIAYYHRPNTTSDWHLMAATARPGKPFVAAQVSSKPVATSLFSSPFGDFFQCAFGPDSKLNIAWTSMDTDLGFEGLNSDIYYARER
ncbi:MAG TPA: sialidase family protein [Frankiaceae bacterium]|jgi:hypothetical protein|nr:sialidase family protein [Frankiaceae bacterium]